jgi:hypothetical protein
MHTYGTANPEECTVEDVVTHSDSQADAEGLTSELCSAVIIRTKYHQLLPNMFESYSRQTA